MSCADHEYEIEEKFNQIAERKKAKKGFFWRHRSNISYNQ